jgi:peptidoglycan-associated lipoprotein
MLFNPGPRMLAPQPRKRGLGKRGALSIVVMCLGFLSAGACGGPRYPSCDNDEQCNTEGHKGVCLQHLCTECRDNTRCAKGQECQSGACAAITDYCEDDKGCEGGSCTADHHCKKDAKVAAVECDDSHACASSAHCENGHCVSPPQGGPGCTSFPAPKFDYESEQLNADGRQVLERLAKCISSGSLKGARVLLTGHCDSRGEYEYNMVLGAQRAEGVKNFLVGLGLPFDKLTTSSRGKLDATGNDEAGWANDRRVDIEVR